jgi:predicted nucleotidyltransferase component of viral defense system
MIDLERIKDAAANDGVTVSLALKEHIHFLVLDYLFKNDFFSNIVFQGGTALRLAYKGVRYSEDLDFVIKDIKSGFFEKIPEKLNQLASYLDRLIPFAKNIRLAVQKNDRMIKRFIISIAAEGFQALDKTNIEFAAVPSYENRVLIISKEGIQASPAICVESPAEILSDKFVAFGARKYLKGRDIWDIFFLSDSLQTGIDDNVVKMCKAKISDYGLTADEFAAKYKKNYSLLQNEGPGILKDEMDKFLPLAYRKLYKPGYGVVCGKVLEVVRALKERGGP